MGLEQVWGQVDAGVHFADCGAFPLITPLLVAPWSLPPGQVADKKLRRLPEDLVAAYDHAKTAAQPAQPLDPEWQLRAPFRVAAAEIDPASPHHRLNALPGEALERIHFLERKAAAY